MRFEVETGGRSRVVEVRRDGARVDGRELALDMVRTGRAWSLLIDTRSYEIFVVEQPGGGLVVHVNGHPVPALVIGGRGATRVRSTGGWRAGATGARDGGSGPRQVTAPMPGRIDKVLVKAGEAVSAGQGLVVVEAMKMENELRSPRAGTVSDVRVSEGVSVEANAVLVVVD